MLEFDAATHTYRYRGAVVPHVTQVCRMLGEYAGVPLATMEAARERGDAVHYATELYDRGELDEASVPAEVSPYLEAWKLFKQQAAFAVLEIEHRVHNETFGFAGTLDRTGYFAGRKLARPTQLCLVDIKATYQVMPQVAVQTALYAYAYQGGRSEHQLMPRFAVQLKPDATYRLHALKDRADLSVGLAALTIHNWKVRNASHHD